MAKPTTSETGRNIGRPDVNRSSYTIGIDLGDKFSHYCVLNPEAEVIEAGRVKTTREALSARFATMPPMRVAMETGTHSAWISQLLESFGHDVIVAHARDLPSLGKRQKTNDPADAEKLARYARFDPTLLHPIQHRSREAQVDLIVIRARAQLVNARTLLINTARGLVKSLGHRLPECRADGFAERYQQQLPAELFTALVPLVQQIGAMTEQIKTYDQKIRHLADQHYPETQGLRTVPGVGALTALTFILTLGDKARFAKSRDVGCYVGMRPRQSQSGERDPQLGITKAGDTYLRKLWVQSAHYMLGPFGPDSAVRRWGLGLAAHGGQNAKKRALVAVARKLAVLLHTLWVRGATYTPFPHGPAPAGASH
jgi:transposase